MMNSRIPYKTIVAAKNGDSIAMNSVLQHYSSYIAFLSKRSFYDEYGNRYELVDEEIRQRIEAKLMLQIVCKFDPTKLPDGENLELN